MEFGKHLGKGIWGLADKALPVVYGLAYVLLVIRVLPEEEFGVWVLLQELFLLISGLATAFALNPLLKFAAEEHADRRQTVTLAVLMQGGFVAVSSVLVLGLRAELGALMHSSILGPLLISIPAMLVASFVRNMALVLLQAEFRVKELFAVDAVHFLGAPLLIWIWSRMHQFDAADDLIFINILSLSLSSVLGLMVCWREFRMTMSLGRETVQAMWNYGVYSLGGTVSTVLTSRADSFVLGAFTGPVAVAVYNSVKIFIRAYEMVTQVVQMFVLPGVSRLTSRGDRGPLTAIVEKSLLFGTIGMIPVFLIFFFGAPVLIAGVYQGRYVEAIPQLQAFAWLAFFIPAIAIASNVLLGLGEARRCFVLGVQAILAAGVLYVILIPFFGVTGATLGYIGSSLVLCWLAVRQLGRFVPLTFRGVFRRWGDIDAFVRRLWERQGTGR